MYDEKVFANISPLIVCGAARSGTRMVTDLLNKHPSFAVEEEMHAKTLEAFFEFVNKVDDNFDSYSVRKGRRLDEHWNLMKPYFFHIFLRCANKKESTMINSDIIYHGIKTPGYERYFSSFEKIFDQNSARYVYCIRDASLVWRSWKSLGFLNDFYLFKTRYLRSLRQACKIKRNAPDRLVVFNLDEFVDSDDKNYFVKKNLFNLLLGESDSSAMSSGFDLVENRNSIAKRGESYTFDKVLENEMKILSEDMEILEYKKILTA